MNWSTRLRRWVRIRTPPVREASMKPTAATVLPAPVACSNQKRRSAPGSSGASATASVVLVLRLLPVLRLLVGREHLVVLVELGDVAPLPFGASPLAVARRPSRRCGRCWRAVARSASSTSATIAASVPESASTWCSLSSAPSSSFGGLLGEQPLEPEQQRVVAPPLERRRLGALVELGERVVDRQPAGGARRQVGDRLAREQDRLAGELPRPIEVGLAQLASRARGYVGGIGHGQGEVRSRARR